MNPSTEVRDAMLRAYEALASGNPDANVRLRSGQEDFLCVATDPAEWWAGIDAYARVIKAQFAEMGKIRITPGDPQGYAEGSVGWGADRLVMHVLGQDIPMRCTMVLHKEDGEWKIVQEHYSAGVPNTETLGKELTTE